MKSRLYRTSIATWLCAFGVLCLAPAAWGDDDWLDRLDESLRVSLFKGAVQARLSGLIDAETYYIQQPPSGLITTNHDFLFNPRLTLNLDAQVGSAIYAFAELRVDRGFDPADQNLQARFDQYAVSVKPWSKVPIKIQVGKFASVVGTWAKRSDSWTNPFINAPLPYENQTPIYDRESPESAADFVGGRFETNERYEQNPIMWGQDYTTGAAIFADLGSVDAAVEVKNASLSSRPEAWDPTRQGWQHPTWSGHLGWQANQMWAFGLSASRGAFLRSDEPLESSADQPALPSGKGIGDFDQTTLAQDITFEWHHWQVWAEFFEARLDVPRVGDADTFAYYLEARYQFSPALFGALRWNQQLFSSVRNDDGGDSVWGNDMERIDAALTYRFTTRFQTKVQYSLILQDLPGHDVENFLAGQFTLRF